MNHFKSQQEMLADGYAPLPLAVAASRLRPQSKVVYAMLARRVNSLGEAWPSQATLARDCGMSRDQVRYALHQLQETGWIEAFNRRGSSNTYLFNQTTTYGVGDSSSQGGGDSPTLGILSPHTKNNIKGSPGPRLVVGKAKRPRKEPRRMAEDCRICQGTGMRSITKKGVPYSIKCNHQEGASE